MTKLKYITAGVLLFMVSFVGGCCGMDAHLKTAEAYQQKRMTVVKSEDVGGGNIAVLKDNETGVCYLFCKVGYGGGLTVMVDAEGKPLVNKE